MNRLLCCPALLLMLCSLHAFVQADDDQAVKPRILLIGDSTVKNGQGRGDGGLWGWGQVLADHFDTSRIDVENHAIGGRSSRTFLTEGRWDRTLEKIRPGDFVIMQFGHNDGGEMFQSDRPRASIKGNSDDTVEGVVEMTGEQETVYSYGWYLRKYIADTKAQGGTPIVCSLVPRNRWQDGNVMRSDRDYGKWAAEAAEDGSAIFIDLNDIVATRYEEIGAETVAREYFTEQDWTHTTLAGAELTAAILAEAIGELNDCQLKEYLTSKQDTQAERPSRNFSFGGQAPSGYVQVAASDTYSPERGYGFEPGATIHSESTGCTSDAPFYFSVALPEGNYRVRATFAPGAGKATIKAELRRLMIHDFQFSADAPSTCEFTVNIRTPEIPHQGTVRLKPREKTTEAWAWDEKLTLEFNGQDYCLASLTIQPEPKATTVYLAGDSTVTDQPSEPWNSWGQMLPVFFRPGLAVANHAESGESIRSSLVARRFDKILSLIQPGDYVLLQFGHNDMKEQAPDALATYRENLTMLVNQIRENSAQPVLVTSMERKSGINQPTLGDYPQAVRDVAAEFDVPLIDLNAMSVVLYRALGNHLEAAFQDGTHHTNYGSYLFAKCVVQSIRDLNLELVEFLVDDLPEFDPSAPDAPEDLSILPSPPRDTTKPLGS